MEKEEAKDCARRAFEKILESQKDLLSPSVGGNGYYGFSTNPSSGEVAAANLHVLAVGLVRMYEEVF